MNEHVVFVKEDPASALKAIMDAEGYTQTKLAEKLDINRQAVQQSLNRRSRNMRVMTMQKMVNAMGYELAVVKTD